MLTLIKDIKYISRDNYGNKFEINLSTGEMGIRKIQTYNKYD